MKYSEARKLIKTGDIVFVNGVTTVGRIIEYFTNSKYSHVGIAVWSMIEGQHRLLMLEAQAQTTRRVLNLSYYSNCTFDVVGAPVNWIEYGPAALKGVGRHRYSYTQALYTGLRDVMNRQFHITLPKLKFSGEICSEFVARCLNLPNTQVSPQDVFIMLQQGGHLISVSVDTTET